MPEVERPETELTVLLFGTLKDAAGSERVSVVLCESEHPATEPFTVEKLVAQVAVQYPALAPWLPYIRVAVNCEYADSHFAIEPGDEVAFLPPVSGGQNVSES